MSLPGKSVEQRESEVNEMLASYCGSCGKQFQSTDTFCAGCGAPRDDANVVNTTLVSAPNAPLGRTPQAAEPANITKATAALCEIELKVGRSCGVSAVGRCDTCQRAYCASHQACGDNDFGGIVPLHNRCVMCEQERLRAKEEEGKRAIERNKSKGFFLDGSALAMMRGSGVQKVKIYQMEAPPLRSGYVTKKRFNFLAEGWVIGNYTWSYYDPGSQTTVNGLFLTALLNKRRSDLEIRNISSSLGLVPIAPYADGYEHLSSKHVAIQIASWDNATWDKAAEAVKKLAGGADE